MRYDRVWITWERQRRSLELAKALKCKLFVIEKTGFWRYPYCCTKTVRICLKYKPKILFVQNPSMILAAVGCLCKGFIGCKLIVDRHSNFLLTQKRRSIFLIMLFKILNYFTLRFADITIVTNQFVASWVRKAGGRAFILEDKLPSFKPSKVLHLKGKKNILLISSFHDDEPIEEALDAMSKFWGSDIYFYISGDYRRAKKVLSKLHVAENIIFTGFLEDKDYINLLFSVDAIMVLTTIDYCLLCGCYEAVAAEKPLITSDTQVLKSLFNQAVFVKPNAHSISNGIKRVVKDLDEYKSKIIELKRELKREWAKKYHDLNSFIAE